MSPTAPLLAVIIVAYKSRDEITGCLESLPRTIEQRPVQIVVVNNSQGDGTDEVVQRQFPLVCYVAPSTNLGFGRANNLGFDRTDPAADFVLFLNPDTICNAVALAQCIARLREDSSIGLISPKLVLADGSMDLACRRSIPTLWDGFCRAVGLAAKFPKTAVFSGYNLTHLPDDSSYDVGAINGAFMMGRREVFEAIAEKTTAESLERSAETVGRAGPLGPPELGSDDNAQSGVPSGRALPSEKAVETTPTASGLPLTASSPPRSTRVFDDTFFMYGDDLDLCIRVKKAGWRIVYDGSVSITHLKGVSVAKDYDVMSKAIFDANRDVYLKHFNPSGSRLIRWKYSLAFWVWKKVALLRAKRRGYQKVRPA